MKKRFVIALLLALVVFVPQAFASDLDDNLSSEDDVRWQEQVYNMFTYAATDISNIEGDMVASVDLSVNAKVGTQIAVVATVGDIDGDTLASDYLLEYWLADANAANIAAGIAGAKTASAPDGDLTVSGGTIIAEHTTSTHGIASTGADGVVDFYVTDDDSDNDWYMCVACDGEIATSLTISH